MGGGGCSLLGKGFAWAVERSTCVRREASNTCIHNSTNIDARYFCVSRPMRKHTADISVHTKSTELLTLPTYRPVDLRTQFMPLFSHH